MMAAFAAYIKTITALAVFSALVGLLLPEGKYRRYTELVLGILVLTAVFDLWGFIAGTVFAVLALVMNKPIAGKSYIYPLIPFRFSELKKRIVRNRLPHAEK